MTVEEYRQRMINAFHNADCDNLIALVALPSKKEFENLEWLLKNHYHNQKQQPCEDCISRQAAIDAFERFIHELGIKDEPYNYGEMVLSGENVPPVTPKEKTGWIPVSERLPEEDGEYFVTVLDYYSGRPFVDLSHYFIGNVHNNGFYKAPKVIAWMPLSEPYKDGDTDE